MPGANIILSENTNKENTNKQTFLKLSTGINKNITDLFIYKHLNKGL